jgi:tetratricopeptide (TPR) repeat protein
MDEAISINWEKRGIGFQLAMRAIEQALNFRAAQKFEQGANLLEESLWIHVLDSLGIDGQWSDNGDFRVGTLCAYAAILIKLGRHQDALTAQQELVTILRGLQPHNREGNHEGFTTKLHGLAALASWEEEYNDAIAAAGEAVSLYREISFTYRYNLTPTGWYKHVQIVCCEGSHLMSAHKEKI